MNLLNNITYILNDNIKIYLNNDIIDIHKFIFKIYLINNNKSYNDTISLTNFNINNKSIYNDDIFIEFENNNISIIKIYNNDLITLLNKYDVDYIQKKIPFNKIKTSSININIFNKFVSINNIDNKYLYDKDYNISLSDSTLVKKLNLLKFEKNIYIILYIISK